MPEKQTDCNVRKSKKIKEWDCREKSIASIQMDGSTSKYVTQGHPQEQESGVYC